MLLGLSWCLMCLCVSLLQERDLLNMYSEVTAANNQRLSQMGLAKNIIAQVYSVENCYQGFPTMQECVDRNDC